MRSPRRQPRGTARHRAAAAVAAAAAVGAAAAALTLAGCARSAPAPAALTTPADRAVLAPGNGHSAVLGLAGQRAASLAVLSGAAAVTVTASAMPGQLVKVSTSADSGIRPQLTEADGRVQVFLSGTGQSGPDAVLIEVNSAVAWQFQFSGGASQTVLDMAAGKVAGVDFSAGCSLINLMLPRPDGTVTITLAGGASQVSLAAPAGVPTRLRLYGGASLATLDGRTSSGLAGGTVLASAGWSAAANRYDVVAPAGISMITASVAS